MNMFANGPLDPANDPTTEVWSETLAEIKARGFEVHGSLRKRNIDSGATAVVVKATESKSGRVVAIKVYKDSARKVQHRNGKLIPMTNFFENERRMLAGLQACSLVPRYYFSVALDDATGGRKIQPFHVMEFVEGKRITEYAKGLKQNKSGLTRLDLFRQVLEAIKVIHQFGYLHRDLSDGNILVDANGDIRLIDLAEASPLGSEHTRLVSTPGYGTEGVATPQQQAIRKIQTDDVRDACTIGYAIFTGKWKVEDEGTDAWKRNLLRAGVENVISDIVVKGMRPRNTTRKKDRLVWNTAEEVDSAIEKVLAGQRTRKRLLRSLIWGTIAASVLILVGILAFQRVREQNFYSEMARLKDAQIKFSEKQREDRPDPRVQLRLDQAENLKEQALSAKSSSDLGDAVDLLEKATAKTNEAASIVDDLKRLSPLVNPLEDILAREGGWSGAPVITRKLTELGKQHQEIQKLIAPPNGQDGKSADELPNQAWEMLASLQPQIVELIGDNQQALEIEKLLNQMTAECGTIAPELKEKHSAEFGVIELSQKRAQRYFTEGNWDAARRELNGDIKGIGIGALASLEQFLEKFESAEQRKQRLASNTDQIATYVATTESLRQQLKETNGQLELAKDAIYDSANFKKERDTLKQKLDSTATELAGAKTELSETQSKLAEASNERSRLEQLEKTNRSKIKDYEVRLKSGTEAWKKQSSELANVKAELKRNLQLVKRLSNGSGGDAAAAKKEIIMAELEKAIQSFDPKSWDVANERLTQESTQYEKLLQKRKQEIAIGKTDRHKDVRTIDAQLASQFRVVLTSLRKRDERDQAAWDALNSQIEHQTALKQATIDEGWSETSSKVRDIEAKIRNQAYQQKPHESGRSRLASNAYDFKNWDELSSLPEVKFAKSLAAFGDLKQGTKYSNSKGQDFVFIPPGTFKMGSPSNETGRDDDETQYEVTLSRGFFVATTETTQGVYKSLMGVSPWSGKDYVKEGAAYPAVYVSWDDTKAFIKKLNQQERENGALPPGWEYRLLTESEWEYAARAGSKTRFCFGDDESELGDYAWFEDNAEDAGEDYAHQVRTKKPNKWGLYDMHGNCWEWTEDIFTDYPYGAVTDPFVENGGSSRVYRGGSFNDSASRCRSAYRYGSSPVYRRCLLGFRLALVQQASK